MRDFPTRRPPAWLQAGEYTEVVTLKKPTLVKDRFGQHTQYDIVAKVPAKVHPLTGNDLFAAGAAQSPASVFVWIRWRVDIESSWHLEWMGREYEVVGVPADLSATHEALQLQLVSVPS